MTVTEKDTEHVKREQEVEETGVGIAKGERGKASKHEAGVHTLLSQLSVYETHQHSH